MKAIVKRTGQIVDVRHVRDKSGNVFYETTKGYKCHNGGIRHYEYFYPELEFINEKKE